MTQQIRPIYFKNLRSPSYSQTASSSSRVSTMCQCGLRTLHIMKQLCKTTQLTASICPGAELIYNDNRSTYRGQSWLRNVSEPEIGRAIREGGNYCLVHLICMTNSAKLKGSKQKQHNLQSVTMVQSFAKPDIASMNETRSCFRFIEPVDAS